MSTFPLTVIIPVHELNAETTELFKAALESVANQKEYQAEKVRIVHPEGDPALAVAIDKLVTDVFSGTGIDAATFPHRNAADIATQINTAVSDVTTQYVTVLEFDDLLDERYIAEMAIHAANKPQVDAWLPLAVCVDENLRLLKYGNEAVWVPKTEEVRPEGFVDNETLEVSPDLLLSGAMLKAELYTEGCALKPSIQLTFVSEFFRRLVGRGAVLRGMGKALYMHRERRPGSYVYEAVLGENALSKEQISYWLDAARTESAFEVERQLATY